MQSFSKVYAFEVIYEFKYLLPICIRLVNNIFYFIRNVCTQLDH
jgi:hypothetical protein